VDGARDRHVMESVGYGCLRLTGDEIKKADRSQYHVSLSVLPSTCNNQIQGAESETRRRRLNSLLALCLEMRIMPPTEDRKHGAPVAAAAQPCPPGGAADWGNYHEVKGFARKCRQRYGRGLELAGQGYLLRLYDMHMGLNHTVYVRRQRGSLPLLLSRSGTLD
jgi:hypothetical protein